MIIDENYNPTTQANTPQNSEYFCIVADYNGKTELITVSKETDGFDVKVAKKSKAVIRHAENDKQWKVANGELDVQLLDHIGQKINKIFLN